jgi:hypothetical protein
VGFGRYQRSTCCLINGNFIYSTKAKIHKAGYYLCGFVRKLNVKWKRKAVYSLLFLECHSTFWGQNYLGLRSTFEKTTHYWVILSRFFILLYAFWFRILCRELE